jgi:hypothetical protein
LYFANYSQRRDLIRHIRWRRPTESFTLQRIGDFVDLAQNSSQDDLSGWITFHPTNRSVGGFNLIPVAVVRDIQQAIPVSGSFVGMTDAFAGMSVEVLVTS